MSFNLVSIIIPSFNNEDILHETINSVLIQSYTNWECIIVDDGSTDNSVIVASDYALKDSRIICVNRPKEKPKGANSCRNYGLEISNGIYIIFLDSDDILDSKALQLRLAHFNTYPEIDLVISNTKLLDSKASQPILNRDPKERNVESYLLKFLSYHLPWWSTLSATWKREAIKNIKFDEQLHRLQDVDFYITALKTNIKLSRLEVVDNYYRQNHKKLSDNLHIQLVLESASIFFKKHIKYIRSKSAYSDAFKLFNNYFLLYYVFPNYHEFKFLSKAFLNHLYKSDLYNKREHFLLRANQFFISANLYKVKGIGMYAFSKFIHKAFKI